MIYGLNETHDPGLKCRVNSAHGAGTDFPIQNLPYGIFSSGDGLPRPGVAIGDLILDLRECTKRGLLKDLPQVLQDACTDDSLNRLMHCDPELWSLLRSRISRLLRRDTAGTDSRQMEASLIPMNLCHMHIPARIGDYTDFYASIHHARNVGSMFRPDNPLFPNYKFLPVGYHGRSSSIVVSGTPVRRPWGQIETAPGAPQYGPSLLLDYELELGAFIGRGNPLGFPVNIQDAEMHLFGVCLVNDWSARDIQKWEYQPLGPFLGKSFATTVSPWLITLEALAPFRVAASKRGPEDPVLLTYLHSNENDSHGGIGLELGVRIETERMRRSGAPPAEVSSSSFAELYWTLAQLVTHHSSNGCNLRPGDLLASGTVSGAEKESRGCLLELTWRGREPVLLPNGEIRRFLEDGDEVIFSGRAECEGFASIGTGECRGIITPAIR